MEKNKVNQKSVEAMVDKAIQSSKDHGELLLSATIAAIQLAASEIGRTQPLSRLYAGVSRADAEGIRFFMVNLATLYGPQVTNAAGRTNGVFFLRYDREKREWIHGDKANENIKAARETFDKLSDAKYRKAEFGPMESRESAAGRAFDWTASLIKLIERGVKEGVSMHDLREASRLVPADQRPNLDAMREKAADDAKKLAERAASAQEKLNRFNETANDKTETPAETPAVTANAA